MKGHRPPGSIDLCTPKPSTPIPPNLRFLHPILLFWTLNSLTHPLQSRFNPSCDDRGRGEGLDHMGAHVAQR